MKSGNLIITFQKGLNANNEPDTYKRTYRNLNVNATAQNLTATAAAFASLLGHSVVKVERQITEEI